MRKKFENAKQIVNDEKLVGALKDLMWEASQQILDVYNNENFETKFKKDNSLVTSADLAAHHILMKGLALLTPNIPVVSEEDTTSIKIGHSADVYWLIDPLDGTKEFVNRNEEFTCNLALIEEKRAAVGFVTIPYRNELFFGGPGQTATKETQSTEPKLLTHTIKPGVTRVVASKNHLNKETTAFIESLSGKVELVTAGSSLKLLKLASGEADLYPRLAPTCEWDIAAAHAILNSIGGRIVQLDGQTLSYGKLTIKNPSFVAYAPNITGP